MKAIEQKKDNHGRTVNASCHHCKRYNLSSCIICINQGCDQARLCEDLRSLGA